MPQALVAKKVDAFVGEIELDALGRAVRDAAAAFDWLMTRRNLRRRLQVQISLGGKLLDQLVEQFAQLLLRFLVAVATQRFEKIGRELSALDQRVEDRLTQRLQRAVRLRIEIVEIRIEALAAGEAGLQQKIRQLVE